MKRILGANSLLWGGALAALAAQPGVAASTVITGVRVNETPSGVEIVLNTEGGNDSKVFTVNQGNVLRADITRAQLNLSGGNEFRQVNPAPGIAAISVVPLDANSVRLTVEGTNQVPVGTVQASDTGAMVFAVQADGTAAQAPTVIPSSIETVPGGATGPVAQASPPPSAEPAPTQAAPAQAAPAQPSPVQTEAAPDVMVPNPDVSIDGVPVPQPQSLQAPPFLPRAVAPPVGDIAVADGNPAFPDIELGSNERIPKLVLRNAPAREVLSLLARAAGLNLVFTSEGGGADGATDPAGGTGGGDGPTVTLDIENESVQDVFNHVLRVSGLEANRVGRSIYVGPTLPISAQNVSVRTLRLNQVEATVASNFLVALGAESAVSRERLVTNVNAVEVGEGATPVTQTATTTVEQVETQRVDYTDGTPILRGLQVVADERTNSVTLVGTPTLVAIATEQLTRIDVRRRQVAINVRVIDINLNAIDASGTSFSFATGDIGLGSTGGVGIINFGATTPAPVSPGTVPSGTPIGPRAFGLVSSAFAPAQFLAQLLATVQSGNAKILTDPTLIVQEGQTATVQLTEEVITNVEATTQVTNGVAVTTLNVEKEPAGLILQIDVNRIDDNGFVSLSVAPSISAPAGNLTISNTSITLLAERLLSSGQVRVRDGQTLLLSGIIQDADRTTVTKVPILGDLPLLGALFRSTTNSNQRRELIVLLTPEVLDDSDQAAYGYSYTPSEEVQDLLEQYR
ncbi:MAG TPA: AMIN domain-containing protein [Leptolyngbyaceae cyanobacterium]